MVQRRVHSAHGKSEFHRSMMQNYQTPGLLLTKMDIRYRGNQAKIEAACRRHLQYRQKKSAGLIPYQTSIQFRNVFGGPEEGSADELKARVFAYLTPLKIPNLEGYLTPDLNLSLITGYSGVAMTIESVLNLVEQHVRQSGTAFVFNLA
jgi:hypothetical protein